MYEAEKRRKTTRFLTTLLRRVVGTHATHNKRRKGIPPFPFFPQQREFADVEIGIPRNDKGKTPHKPNDTRRPSSPGEGPPITYTVEPYLSSEFPFQPLRQI